MGFNYFELRVDFRLCSGLINQSKVKKGALKSKRIKLIKPKDIGLKMGSEAIIKALTCWSS